jgi:hypothetical protein
MGGVEGEGGGRYHRGRAPPQLRKRAGGKLLTSSMSAMGMPPTVKLIFSFILTNQETAIINGKPIIVQSFAIIFSASMGPIQECDEIFSQGADPPPPLPLNAAKAGEII